MSELGERVIKALENHGRVLAPAVKTLMAEAWLEGHVAGRDYQGDGWNSDAHDPADDNPYKETP